MTFSTDKICAGIFGAGPWTVLLGFVFALLTVLARQKTVAALLLIFPLFVIVILVGGAMLAFLERTISAGDDEK